MKRLTLKTKTTKPRIIGIVGSRRRNSGGDFTKVIDKFLEIYEEGDIICSGGCPQGGDFFAYKIHKEMCIPYLEFPANWLKYGKGAGHMRNTDIAKWSDILIAVVSDDRTGGTEDCIYKYSHKFKKTRLYLL